MALPLELLKSILSQLSRGTQQLLRRICIRSEHRSTAVEVVDVCSLTSPAITTPLYISHSPHNSQPVRWTLPENQALPAARILSEQISGHLAQSHFWRCPNSIHIHLTEESIAWLSFLEHRRRAFGERVGWDKPFLFRTWEYGIGSKRDKAHSTSYPWGMEHIKCVLGLYELLKLEEALFVSCTTNQFEVQVPPRSTRPSVHQWIGAGMLGQFNSFKTI